MIRSQTFMDTAAWIALINPDDGLYTRAVAVYSSLVQRKVPLVTTDFVLLEVADALGTPAIRARTISFINGLRRGAVRIVPVSEELMMKGWALYCQRLDKEWGLTDCTSFVIMQEEGISEAFTSDHHFTQAGFSILLSNKPQGT